MKRGQKSYRRLRVIVDVGILGDEYGVGEFRYDVEKIIYTQLPKVFKTKQVDCDTMLVREDIDVLPNPFMEIIK